MFLLTLCVEVSQSQGGFEVQSSQFMWLLLGAYLKSRNLDIRYHQTSCQKMSEGINSTKPKGIKHIFGPLNTLKCAVSNANTKVLPTNYTDIPQSALKGCIS